MSEQSILLPPTCDAILEEFGDGDESALVRAVFGDFGNRRVATLRRQLKIRKYCVPSLVTGRPLGSTVIFMAGQSGAGKSSTINALFEDPTLCAVNSEQAETRNVTMFRKNLNVTKEKPSLRGSLSLVDVPGTFDDDSRFETANFDLIKTFRESEISLLSSRASYHSKIRPRLAGFTIRKTVYPNLVLLVHDAANDTRINGPDSFFRQTLRALRQLNIVDTMHPNLIVVVTKAMSIPLKRYADRTEEIRLKVQFIIEEELVVSNAPVVFVENKPGDYDMQLVPGTDFYRLPDGELSHENLIQEVFKIFKRNNDILSSLFVGWYYNPNCPDRKLKAESVTSTRPIKPNCENKIAELSRELGGTGFQTNVVSSTPAFNFQSLGYGYCPVNEEVKHTNLLGPRLLEAQEVVIQNTKFLVPMAIRSYTKNTSMFHRVSFQEKEEYQNHMKASYGIEGGFKLVVQGSSNGRWINDSSGKLESSLISLVQEIQVATFRLDNPNSAIMCPEFLAELTNLPSEYSGDTAHSFQAFFSRWGTHMICEQAIGGALQLDCTLKSSHLNKDSTTEIESKVSEIFNKCFCAGNRFDLGHEAKSLSDIGVVNEKLQIEGGNPPPLASLSTLKPEQLDDWAKSVVDAPTELKRSIKLYPYYNLLASGSGYEALRKATEEILSSKLETTIDEITSRTREGISIHKTDEIIDMDQEKSQCFPKGTQLKILDNEGTATTKAIESLHKTDVLATLKTSDFLGHSIGNQTTTSFCTHLHVESDELFDYLVLSFSNGKQLVVSADHLIFWIKEGQLAAKQAAFLSIGDQAIFVSDDQQVETPKCIGILKERRLGAYAPLTYSGTFLADGFLVSSYADVESFAVAQAAFSPLKMWHRIKSKLSKSKSTPVAGVMTEGIPMQGIHPFAKILIKTRDRLTFS